MHEAHQRQDVEGRKPGGALDVGRVGRHVRALEDQRAEVRVGRVEPARHADVLVARSDGVEMTGTGTSTDIIEASALAWLDVANRVARRAPQRVAAVA